MASEKMNQHFEMLGASLSKLYETGTYSDLIITCGNDIYQVHKVIVCPRSSFFTAACSGKFKEGQEGKINLPDDDPDAVREMIHYLYHLDLAGHEFIPADGNFLEGELSTTEHDDALKQFLQSQGHRFVGNRRVKGMVPKLAARIGPSSNLCLFAKVYALGEKQGGGPPPLFNANEERNDYMESLPVFLKTGEFSDLIIVCGNDRYRVHRFILGGRSNFFKVACNGNFKESDGEINLPDDDPAAVRKMIGYLYNIDYNPTTKQMPDYEDDVEAELSDTEYDAETRYRMRLFGVEFIERKRIKQLKELEWGGWQVGEPTLSPQLSLHAKVYALGEKYRIEGLKKAGKGKFESEIQSGNVGIDDFAEAAEEVYTSTVSEDRGLRDVVVKMIELDILLLDHVVVREVMRATDFALDVLLYMSQGMRSRARFKDSPETVSLGVWGS
ncbi:hypothetical protein ACKLNR_013494 [Fusarium oxysporum f. sp. zingiberi]